MRGDGSESPTRWQRQRSRRWRESRVSASGRAERKQHADCRDDRGDDDRDDADYIEIRQLVARYAYAVDTGADNGNVYASLFAPDGAFADRMGRETKGRDALAALARRNTRGPQSAFHFIVNHVIEPTSDGAIGKEYLLQLRMGDGDRPNDVFGGGHYEDAYVKTPEGWRFKRRQFIPSEGGPRPRPPREAEAR